MSDPTPEHPSPERAEDFDILIDDHMPDRDDAESNHNDVAHELGYVQEDWASGAEWDSDTPMTEDELR